MEIMGGEMREAQHVAEFQRQYDVVTFDPRGIGKSSPISCDPGDGADGGDADGPQADPGRIRRGGARQRRIHRELRRGLGELLWHLSANDTAQDIERIRQALSPNDGIVSYAASYGSAYGGRLSRSLSART